MSHQYAVIKAGSPYKFTKWHESLSEAVEEAKRLAVQEHSRFIVIRMIGYADRVEQPVEYTEV